MSAPRIKHPPVLDISHWIDVPDFRQLDPLPWLIVTKATQGTWLLDVKYGEYAEAIPAAGIRLGAFHFMEPGDEVAQAEWFCEILLTVGLRGDEVLACDMEMAGISLEQIRRFLDRVELRTGIRPIIYSTQLMLEGLYPNGVCPEWLKDEWVWPAEYPLNPDPINEIPPWIVPRGLSTNNVAMWQYTDDGVIAGIPGNNVDLNLINPLYVQAIGLTEPVLGGTPMPEQYYEVVSTDPAKYRTIRSAPIVSQIDNKIGEVKAGTRAKAYIEDMKVYAENVYEGSLLRAKTGDRWVHVFENNGAPVNGWVAEVHLGVRYTTLTVEDGTTPTIPDPTVRPDLPVSITLGDDITYARQTVNVILKPKV